MRYLDAAIKLLEEVRDTQGEAIHAAASAIADAIAADHMVYAFGPSHAGIMAQELFYRAGGLVPVNPILPPGLTTDARPITLTSQMERLPGYGKIIIDQSPIQAGDVLIAISVSGRNITVVEAAQQAKARGALIIVVTSLEYSKSVKPRTPGAPRLFEVADIVLDCRAPVGDALAEIPGIPQKVSPVSTVTGTAILNEVVAQTAELLYIGNGEIPPVFLSANLDGGDAHNQRWLDHYRGRLTYL